MKKLIIILSFIVCLSSCSDYEMNESSVSIKNEESSVSIKSEESSVSIQNESYFSIEEKNGYVPLNFTNQTGYWIPYMRFEDYMYNKSRDEYTEIITAVLENIKDEGVNTVYFHVHPNGDSYYDSEIFSRGVFYTGDYDPFEIMLDIAHDMGLSVHAWINPLRLFTVEQAENIPDSFILKQWINDNSPYIREVNGRWYLNPAYEEVRNIVSECAEEIIKKYNVDGIHIDDYFYPTTDPSFDSDIFNGDNLAEWRIDNINKMVKSLYDTIKLNDKRIRFGISPQGNIAADYNNQYADVKLWASSEGYADYIVPQIYFGFNNESCPFLETLAEWEKISEIPLVIGLARYKSGEFDKWAGKSGENEWIENPDVIQRQIEVVRKSSAVGYALYD